MWDIFQDTTNKLQCHLNFEDYQPCLACTMENIGRDVFREAIFSTEIFHENIF